MTTNLYFNLKPVETLLQQLWLSISKVDFYYNVYRFYQGYGVKYFLYLIGICTIITCIFISDNIFTFKNYFSTGHVNSRTVVMNHIVKQIPELHYNGNNLVENTQTSVPIYINDPKGRKLAVFDINNTLSLNERKRIPIIFTPNKIIVNVISNQKNRDNITLDYPQILGNQAKIIDKESVKASIKDYFDNSSLIFTSFLVILFSAFFVVFCSTITLLKQFFIVSLIYIIISSMYLKFDPEQVAKKFISEFAKILRLILFSSGSISLIQILFIYLVPNMIFMTNFLHLWIGYLIYNGIAKNIQSIDSDQLHRLK